MIRFMSVSKSSQRSSVVGETVPVSEDKAVRQRRVEGGRQHRWTVRASDEDAEVLKAKADSAGLSVPRFLVECAVGSEGLTAPERKARLIALRALKRQLSGACNNLNQIARVVNSGAGLPESLDDVLADLERRVEVLDERLEGWG